MTEAPNTISGLMRKRAEITGKIEYTQRTLNELIIDLDHLDHTIRLIDPDADISLSKSKQYPIRHNSFRGEMSRFVMGALRTATKPVTSLEIAMKVIEGRGLNPDDERTVILFRKRVGACLSKLKRRGTVREVPTTGSYKGWEMVG